MIIAFELHFKLLLLSRGQANASVLSQIAIVDVFDRTKYILKDDNEKPLIWIDSSFGMS